MDALQLHDVCQQLLMTSISRKMSTDFQPNLDAVKRNQLRIDLGTDPSYPPSESFTKVLSNFEVSFVLEFYYLFSKLCFVHAGCLICCDLGSHLIQT